MIVSFIVKVNRAPRSPTLNPGLIMLNPDGPYTILVCLQMGRAKP